MPNWTTNTIIETTGDVDRYIRNSEGIIDFSVAAPMPEIIQRTNSPMKLGPNSRVMLHYPRDIRAMLPTPASEKMIEATEEEHAELLATDYESWYEWCIDHWGTKWNACHTGRGSLEFETAWAHPEGWFTRLEEIMPAGTSFIVEVRHEGEEASLTILVEGTAQGEHP